MGFHGKEPETLPCEDFERNALGKDFRSTAPSLLRVLRFAAELREFDRTLYRAFASVYATNSNKIHVMKIKALNEGGFTLVEIMIVVVIIGLLAAIAVPNFMTARNTAQLNAIVNNLRIVEGGKDTWALESKKGSGATPANTDLAPYIKGNSMPKPVVGETYNINVVGTPATASLPGTVKLGTIAVGGTVTLP